MPSTDLSTYLYELLQAPQESCEIGTIIIISQKRKPRREEAKSPAEATPGRAPRQASLRSLLPLHLRAPGPAPQTPLPALFFPSLRWICTDLSNTHSLDLPTALQKSECPDLGVQSTAPEHSSISRTCAPSLLGPKSQAKHHESRSSSTSSWNSNFPKGWTVASSPEPQPPGTPTQTLSPPSHPLLPHRERFLSRGMF